MLNVSIIQKTDKIITNTKKLEDLNSKVYTLYVDLSLKLCRIK